ncbi:hypothetical protein FRC01_012280 [Tulasnella sp. 417]|nr:hypothetical protein FRC01_012280 [Tulasnella sp. 417]
MGGSFFYIFSFATRTEWLLYALGTFSTVISGMAFPALDIVYGRWIEAQAVPNPDSTHITYVARWTALACLGMGIVQGIAAGSFLTCFSLASANLAARLRLAYVRSVIHQDAQFFEDVGPGEVGTRIVKDIGTVKTAAGEKLGFLIWGFSTLLAALITSFIMAPRLAGVLFAILPVGLILFAVVATPGEKVQGRITEADGKANTFLEQILSSIRIVQAFAAENVLIAKYDEHLHGLERDGTARAAIKALETAVSYFVLTLVYSTAIWFGSQEVTKHGLAVSSFFTCFWNFFNALYAIANIMPHVTAVIESASAQEHLKKVINRKPLRDVRDSSGLRPEASEWSAKIDLNHVTFIYPSRPDAKSLDDVTATIDAGQVTAIVGPSGSGKSTIAGLLLRLWDLAPVDEEGKAEGKEDVNQLLIGSIDIKAYNLSWLRSQISVVRQDPQLFTATIFENVAHGLTGTPYEYNPDAPESDLSATRALVQEALEKAQAWGFVSSLPHGMDTKVSGAKVGVLSGGQRQRIAVARALVRKPKILVLDEGTSALDAEIERRLMDEIHSEQQARGMTTITIQAAHNIIVMDQGRLVEQGRYEDLLQRKGLFASMVAQQSTGSKAPQIGDIDGASETESSGSITPKSFAQQSPLSSEPPIPKMGVLSGPSEKEMEAADPNREANTPSENLPLVGTWGPRYWRYITAQFPWFGGGSLAALGIGATFPLAAWLVGLTAKAFSIQDDDARLRREAYRWSLAYLFIAIGVFAMCFTSAFLLEGGVERMGRRLRIASLRAILRQEVEYFDRESNSSGALTAVVSTYSSSASSVLGMTWLEISASSWNMIGAVLLSFILSWKISVVSFIPLPAAVLAAYLNVVVLEKYESQQKDSLEKASSYAAEHVENIQTVAALGREEAVLRHFELEMERRAPPRRQLYLASVGFGVGTGFVLLVSAVVMAWGTSVYARREITLAELTTALEAIILAGFSSTRVFSFIPDIARAVNAFRNITAWELRQRQMQILPPSASLQRPFVARGDIEFKVCSLQYRGQQRNALCDVSLKIKAGQTVAFCGPSGGGKSSILALINRFYDPSSGTLEVDGNDVRTIPLSEYRSNLSIVTQDAILYDGSFRENITLGIGREVSDAELEDVSRKAYIYDFITSLPDKFDTNVGLKGAQMSGGQRQCRPASLKRHLYTIQRVCIARALLRDPKILLLDEATSALDVESEKYIQKAFDEASQGRTTICVAHRLSTIRNADVIYVVEDGQIIEFGDHRSLLARRGRYFDLVKMQL